MFMYSLLVATIAVTSVFADNQPGNPDSNKYSDIGKFRNTWYYLVREADYPNQAADTPILDMNNEELAKVPAEFKKAMDIEGSGKLKDGRVLNFAGIINKEIRYHFTIHPYGRGVGNCPLLPYHTVAIDTTRIKLGSLVYIDETAGIELPDGTKHDGFWRAEDVGGAIKKDRIDLFLGEGFNGYVLQRAGIKNLQPLTVRLVAEPAEKNCATEAAQ